MSRTALHPARATSARGRAAECLQGIKKQPLSPNTTLQGIQTCSQIFAQAVAVQVQPSPLSQKEWTCAECGRYKVLQMGHPSDAFRHV